MPGSSYPAAGRVATAVPWEPIREITAEPRNGPVATQSVVKISTAGTAPHGTSSPNTTLDAAAAAHTSPTERAGTMSVHAGWVIQVGAFEGEREAREKLSTVKAKASHMLGRADPFTEPVVKGDKTFYRARFAGLQKDEAEAICRQLKRNDIDCMTIKN